MIFDQLCGIAERYLPELIPFLEQAELFIFPGRPQDILPKKSPDTETRDYFFMPFPVMAVEDTATCTILMDTETKQMGISGRRNFIDCMPLFNSLSEFDPAASDPEIRELFEKNYNAQWEQNNHGVYSISMGYIHTIGTQVVKQVEKVTAKGETTWFRWVHKNKGIVQDTHDVERLELQEPDMVQAARKSAASNALTALQEVMFFSDPSRFILETCPVKKKNKKIKKKRKNQLKIPRSNNRSTYIFVEPNKIYDKFGVSASDPVRQLQKGHQRKRFIRKLRHTKYSESGVLSPKYDDRGPYYKVAPVKQTWVGPESAIIKKQHYKVRVDLWEKAWEEKGEKQC